MVTTAKMLIEEVERATMNDSHTKRAEKHAAFLTLVSRGWSAVPDLIEHLRDGGGLVTLVALNRITGEDPIPREHWGNMKAMRKDWLKWSAARQHAGEGEKHGT